MSPLPEVAWVAALAQLPGVGPARLAALLELGSPGAVWEAAARGRAVVRQAAGRAPLAEQWQRHAAQVDVASLWEDHRRHGIGVLWRHGPAYPARLVDDPEPAEVLFSLGDPGAPAATAVAIVGTRRCTRYGLDVAEELGWSLARAGVTVVSGLALGIDAAAHRGALAAELAPPVAVVGTALDTPYPRQNASLWREVADAGLILSETPLGAATERWRFPARNRIIAGLADVTVVVESNEAGGSLYTAAQAMDRDRVVMAVPGPIRSPASVGCNRLLADGCHPVCSIDDVLEAVGFAQADVEPAAAVEVGAEEHAVLDAIGWQPSSLDEIVRRTGQSVGAVASALEALDGRGLVARRDPFVERTRLSAAVREANDPTKAHPERSRRQGPS